VIGYESYLLLDFSKYAACGGGHYRRDGMDGLCAAHAYVEIGSPWVPGSSPGTTFYFGFNILPSWPDLIRRPTKSRFIGKSAFASIFVLRFFRGNTVDDGFRFIHHGIVRYARAGVIQSSCTFFRNQVS
jgi:hypothetical protein